MPGVCGESKLTLGKTSGQTSKVFGHLFLSRQESGFFTENVNCNFYSVALIISDWGTDEGKGRSSSKEYWSRNSAKEIHEKTKVEKEGVSPGGD